MKKLLSVMLLLSLMLSAFACASDDAAGTADTTAAETTEAAAETTTEAELTSGLPEKDFEGKNFHFFVMGEKRNVNNYSVEIFAESENGDPINDAVYARNAALEEQYNFTISEFQSENGNMSSDAQKLIQAGDDVYQVLMFNLNDARNLAKEKMLLDLNSMANLDLSQPWWDGLMAEDLAIMNKLYFAMGDINIMDNNGTWAVFFNKKLIDDNNLDTPYDHVADRTWTLDKYLEMAQAVAADLDGNGKMDPDDRWGTVGESFNAYMLYIASGERISVKDADGTPRLVDPTERSMSVIEKVYAIMLDTDRSTINAHDYSSNYGNVFSELIRGNFKTDRSLFYIAGLLTYTLLRDMESEYGMVPLPAFDENQDDYYTSISPSNGSSVCVPITAGSPDDVGFVLEAMAFESMDTLTPAYYEIALERKYMRDEESREMLDIILDSRIYDLAVIFNWGGVYSLFDNMVKTESIDYMSKFAAIKEKAETELAETISSFGD